MRMVHTDPELYRLQERVFHYASAFGMTLPEIRFYILEGLEFASLLEKHVYPVSPTNIWEGKRMLTKKFRIREGLESSLYYEVVQTGDPSYAYLNHGNSPMMQASVMAHVCGHCEFSEINVLRDSNFDRTEYVMWLVKKVELGRKQMGEKSFINYWNASESAVPLIQPNSQYNLERSVETDRDLVGMRKPSPEVEEEEPEKRFVPVSTTLDALLRPAAKPDPFQEEMRSKRRQETMDRRGYRLKAPCQDIFGFLRHFAPATRAEKTILDYLYVTHGPTDFVIKTQIMNEGWAMYWEKKIMLELFKEKACKGIIDYAKVFSGVCYPRPYYQRNPYHLGFHLWCHIEELFREGKVSLDYFEETDQERKDNWSKPGSDPIDSMRHLVRTVTDYEFLRRFLTPELVFRFHLNRIPQRDVARLGISKRDVVQEDRHWVWLDPKPIKGEMLKFFTHYYRPRIYVIDDDFEDGGLLLFHRNDGRRLKANWIQPTLKNVNMIWKAGVFLISQNTLYGYSGGRYREMRISELEFDAVVERMTEGRKPLVLS